VAVVAGPLVGLAVVVTAVGVAAALGGWPSSSFEFGGMLEILPRTSGVSALLNPVVFGAAWFADASIRRWLVRRLAYAELSSGAALISVVLAPGLWLLAPATGAHAQGAWLWSIVAGPVFLRWNARRVDRSEARRIDVRVAACVGVLVLAGIASGFWLLTSSANLALDPSFSTVGVRHVSGASYEVHGSQPFSLKTLVGNRRRPQTAFYDLTVGTNDSAIPLRLTGARVVSEGPSIRVSRVEFLSNDGSGTPPASTFAVDRSRSTIVRIELQLRGCPATAPPAISSISSLVLSYTSLGIRQAVTLRPASPLRGSCP
jgi:hypothetical protein